MKYSATKQLVYNRGAAPDAFLDELVTWGRSAPDDLFAVNQYSDIYSSVKNTLGPWRGIDHRRAVMLEVLRVLAGYESSWDWNCGVDTNNPNSDTPAEFEAGIFQVSADSMAYNPALKQLVKKVVGNTNADSFQAAMKANHELAIEYAARLLRFTTQHHGPIKKGKIHAWLRTDAVAEFEELLRDGGGGGGGAQPIIPKLKTPASYAEIEAMFGNPARSDGTLNPTWESQNIRTVTPPLGWRLYYQDEDGLIPVSGMRIHKKLEDSFQQVLTEIWNFAKAQIGGNPSDDAIRQWLHVRRLDQHTGAFNFRPKRGSSGRSLHSYGIAIDWDADHNPQGSPQTTLPAWWYEIWHRHGWTDGRTYSKPDPMHVQFAKGV